MQPFSITEAAVATIISQDPVPGVLVLKRRANPRDPWEPMNRGVFEFNQTFDEVAFKPVAVAYKSVTLRFAVS